MTTSKGSLGLHTIEREEPDLVRLACAALEHLGSEVAVPGLIKCLRDTEPTVRDSANRALRGITGRTLPPDPELWVAVLSTPRTAGRR